MPLDASRNSLVLPILGLLIEEPAHGYEIASRLAARYPQLGVRRSSVTTLLSALTERGLLAPSAPQSVANRPARTTYLLTAKGIEFFQERVGEALADSMPASLDFVMALAYLGVLPTARAIGVLRARAERLRRDKPVIPSDLPEMQMIEAHYWLRVLATEIDWLTETADRLATGELEVLL